MVVDREYRERGLAKVLLNQLRQDDDDIYGLMSSHPAWRLRKHLEVSTLIYYIVDSVLKITGSINTHQLDFIGEHAKAIMEASPLGYVKDSKLYGSLFNPEDTSGHVSCVNTGFFVDHAEPLEALAWVREEWNWPLGKLYDGHEFVLILEVRRRARSRSRPTSGPKSVS